MNKLRMIPEEMVLLVIDLQERLLAAMDHKDLVVRNTNILLKLAELYKIPVIVTEQYPKGLGRTVPEIAEKLCDHTLIEKTRFSALVPELKEKLAALNRRRILVVGTETHVCVYQTVRDLLQEEYVVHVAKDAVCSRFTLNHENGLDLMREAGAVITNTETVVFDVLKEAGTTEFKTMSALVK